MENRAECKFCGNKDFKNLSISELGDMECRDSLLCNERVNNKSNMYRAIKIYENLNAESPVFILSKDVLRNVIILLIENNKSYVCEYVSRKDGYLLIIMGW